MMHKPDLIKTLMAGTYKLISDFSETISSGVTSNYLTYEEAQNSNIHKTR